MTFNSVEFALFLPLVVALYWQLGLRGQNRFLLVASYVFYGWWDWRFLGLILASTVIDYTINLLMEARDDDDRARKRLMLTSIVANLGILGTFKYFDFFADSLSSSLDDLGISWAAPSLGILLPVGISFYTFQTMSYTLDVYRRRMRAERNFVDVAVYVAYFPQLVAGPIERATNLMPQVTTARRRPDGEQIRSGLLLILMGLAKKVAVADALAPFVNDAFSDPSSRSGLVMLFAVYGFAFQIYADFSGYSDIARGTSRLLGIELVENFAQPYLSRNITVFWRSWHISLSDWLRDYLYISLGGNRKGQWKTYRNLMLTMLLGGLWHGASWNFVIWGGLQGLFLATHRRFRMRSDVTRDTMPTWGDVPAIIATFHLTCFAWIFFRAASFSEAVDVISRIASLSTGFDPAMLLVAVMAVAMTALDLVQRRGHDHTAILRYQPLVRGALYASMFLLVLGFSGTRPVQFIYFQF